MFTGEAVTAAMSMATNLFRVIGTRLKMLLSWATVVNIAVKNFVNIVVKVSEQLQNMISNPNHNTNTISNPNKNMSHLYAVVKHIFNCNFKNKHLILKCLVALLAGLKNEG